MAIPKLKPAMPPPNAAPIRISARMKLTAPMMKYMMIEYLSTMSTISPVLRRYAEEGIFERFSEGLQRVRDGLGDRICTKCRYCMPCPQGVNITQYMELYTRLKAFGLEEAVRDALPRVKEDKRVDNCDDCAACEEKCPNDLPVREMMKELASLT